MVVMLKIMEPKTEEACLMDDGDECYSGYRPPDAGAV